MKQMSSRRGSALLVVLGILSFMIVSAVAFSAFMRYSRLPSSYLRRTVATRQLVKAALANAIDTIDRGIANNPHPGLDPLATQQNYWQNRVYVGNVNNLLTEDEFSETVPVLTLEGLAYLPPSLVNDVRYYSRLSPAAKWQSLDFDAGRYAFCAVDVSDYLDVNRLVADGPRASAETRRISLAHLFENANHTGPATDPAQWDDWLIEQNLRAPKDPQNESLGFKYNSNVPLVSLADFNLALGSTGQATGFTSPFYEFISSGNSAHLDTFDTANAQLPRMTFVTDSLLPPTPVAADEDADLNLSNEEDQPFPMDYLDGSRQVTFQDIYELASDRQGDTTANHLRNRLSFLGLFMLCDYLDVDHVPLSLAIPSVERLPMLCGLKPDFAGAKIAVKEPASPASTPLTDANGNQLQDALEGEIDVYQKVAFVLDGDELCKGLKLSSLYAYPFPRTEDSANTTYTIDGRVSLFFTLAGDEKMTLRLGGSMASASTEKPALCLRKDEPTQAEITASGLINIPFKKEQKFTVPTEEEQAIKAIDFGLSANARGFDWANKPFLEVTYTWKAKWKAVPGGAGSYSPATWVDALNAGAGVQIHHVHSGIPPLKATGMPYSDAELTEKLRGLSLGSGNVSFNLNAAVWMRVSQEDEISGGVKTLDLVPACLQDDTEFNDIQFSGDYRNWAERFGWNYGLMRFDTQTGLTFQIEADPKKCLLPGLGGSDAASGEVNITPSVVYVDDPRYNHAPENWYKPESASDLSAASWLNDLSLTDHEDIFMAVSDQGYLQSVYELAFLPRVTDLRNTQSRYSGDYVSPLDGRAEFLAQSEAVHTKNNDLMWKTYQPYQSDEEFEAFEDLGIVSGERGFRINPYSDATNVLMAAFANTPISWGFCSTNHVLELEKMSAQEFNQKYAWNQYNASAPFEWQDLEGIAGAFMSAVRSQPTQDWRLTWKNLWRDFESSGQFGSHTVNADLKSIDRKFLYGFWTDCFAAKQQLFLIFVRAEPLMMGGGELSRIPPQLGARAVALVWRDPTNPNTEEGTVTDAKGYPHRTRVLFYKQLD